MLSLSTLSPSLVAAATICVHSCMDARNSHGLKIFLMLGIPGPLDGWHQAPSCPSACQKHQGKASYWPAVQQTLSGILWTHASAIETVSSCLTIQGLCSWFLTGLGLLLTSPGL